MTGEWPGGLDPWAFLIVALAAFRVTRFVVFDSLVGAHPESGSRFSRWLDGWAWDAEGEDRSWLRGKVGTLLACPWCSGFWITAGVYAAWLQWPQVRWLWLLWAAAGVAGVLSTWERR